LGLLFVGAFFVMTAHRYLQTANHYLLPANYYLLTLKMDASPVVFVYGAYGYTAKLLIPELLAKGIRPMLGGRNAGKLKDVAVQYGLPYIAGKPEDMMTVLTQHPEIKLVANCAGPFAETFEGVASACLARKVHYIDITGEIEVFEQAAAWGTRAAEAGIMLMPGTGFDVVPSDCLALHLKQRLPSATHLELAFYGTGGVSRGTALTMVRGLAKGGAIRENGTIKSVPMDYSIKEIDFFGKKKIGTTIPWGDVSTAFYTTGIPNIVVYTVLPRRGGGFTKMIGRMEKWPVLNLIPKAIRGMIRAFMSGPNDEVRTKAKSYLVGEVHDAAGGVARARMKTREGYTLTALTCAGITARILAGDFKVGFQTPAACYGEGLILEVEGTLLEDL
jgi:short subunit dehydrogenase-like uncharacterized protein